MEEQHGSLVLRGPRAQYNLKQYERANTIIIRILSGILGFSKTRIQRDLSESVHSWAKPYADSGRDRIDAIRYTSDFFQEVEQPR